jgi:small nuclear ribonucleoprotein (snRNP)-like protein
MKIDLEEFVNKTVVVTREDGSTRDGVIEKYNGALFHPYKWRQPDGYFTTYTRNGYYWEDKRPWYSNIKSIKLKDEEPMIDLEQFVNKTVVVTREDGFTREGVIERNDHWNFPYKLKYSVGSFNTYARDGYFWPYKGPSPANIKSIKLKEETLEQRLETIQREAEAIKQQLKMTFPTLQDANPGDELEDGCIVIEKYNNAALIAAPQSTEIYCQWTPEFQPVFDKLKEHNFNPSQWFIPTANQLKLAHKNAKHHFRRVSYTYTHWSCDEFSKISATTVELSTGNQSDFYKDGHHPVRAFRFVSF